MIVALGQVDEVIESLRKEYYLSLDTETTGLMLWKEDRLFSVILGSSEDAFYFNFWAEEAHDGSTPPTEFILPKSETLKKISTLFQGKCIFMHNAKFDMCALDKEGAEGVWGVIHDTEVGARVERNDYLSYELASCAERIKEEKSNAVEEYIKEHKLWEWKAVPGKKSRIKNKFYYKVPFSIIAPYGEMDAKITYKLGIKQLESIKAFDDINSVNKPRLSATMEMETKVTPVAYSMEKAGIKVDLDYCDKAIEFEDARALKVVTEFKKLTGFDFKDSGKHLAQVFSAMGLDVPQTEKGNPSFTDEVLEGFNNPVSKLLQDYRDAQKRANTYFRSFKFYSDDKGILHTNLKQAGTATGRFSCTNPNLQNLSKGEEDSPFPVRRAFVPREDYFYTMIDYNQMEFRMMLDYAGQLDLINKIIEGHDPHQSTADLTGLTRDQAKTLNFGLLYGMGAQKLALALGLELMDAKKFRYKYFSNLPKVSTFLKEAAFRAEKQGFVRGWDGRLFYFKDPDFSYKAPNAIIQGGCSSIMKIALCRQLEYLKGRKSKLIMTVHDEMIIETHFSEAHIIPEAQEIMETVYPHRFIPLTCSTSHSLKSWGEPTKGLYSASGNQIQESGQKRSERFTGDGLSTLVH